MIYFIPEDNQLNQFKEDLGNSPPLHRVRRIMETEVTGPKDRSSSSTDAVMVDTHGKLLHIWQTNKTMKMRSDQESPFTVHTYPWGNMASQ